MNASNKRGEGTRDGVRNEVDEGGARDDGHQAEAEQEMVEAQEIQVGFTMGFKDDDIGSGLKARGEFDGAGVIPLAADSKFRGNELVGKAAGEFCFLEQGERADGNFACFAEDDVAGGDAGEIGGGAFADQAADDDKAEK